MKTKMNQHLFSGGALTPWNGLTWWSPNPHVLEKVAQPFFHLHMRFVACDIDIVLVEREWETFYLFKSITLGKWVKTKAVGKLVVYMHYLFFLFSNFNNCISWGCGNTMDSHQWSWFPTKLRLFRVYSYAILP